jgi:DNA-binding SARP family transcriptional activator/tetratricopeptide (TPR) repeat protein
MDRVGAGGPEIGEETSREVRPGPRIRLLGPVGISRDGAAVPLPRSRKVRALLGYLALEPGPHSRSRLCDLLWNAPNDPRGELRWSLSKLRALLDDGERRRVVTVGSTLVSLDLSDCLVDAIEVERLAKAGVAQATTTRLSEVRELFGGDLLEGDDLDGSPELSAWLAARRQRHRALRVAVLGELATRSPPGSEEARRNVEKWMELAPFDPRAHQAFLATLVEGGGARDAEAHVAEAIRSFEQEGLDWTPLRDWWHAARRSAAEPARSAAVSPGAALPQPHEKGDARARRRGSVAVMPFVETTPAQGASSSQLAHGVTEDVITRLAKLRVLFVIARGTAYALGERGVSAQEAGRILNVEWVVSGSVRRTGSRISVTVEVAETREARIVWTDELHGVLDETFSVLDAIVDRIVAAIAEEISSAECQRAILAPPSSLDAWEAYHRGLWHMYRFTGPDNRDAARFFRSALALDPTFARAYAGLSFTHFQNVFLELTADRDRQMALALETAGRSLAADERDPAAHWAMGRALWLGGAQGESIAELERSIELSPNFALGHYTLGFVLSQSGDPRSAILAASYSLKLSPFDPLQFGMLGSRALAHLRMGELEEAAAWAVKATRRPNAHAHILAIAAACLSLAGRRAEALELVARIREHLPGYDVERFLRAFRFEAETEALIRRSAARIGFGG